MPLLVTSLFVPSQLFNIFHLKNVPSPLLLNYLVGRVLPHVGSFLLILLVSKLFLVISYKVSVLHVSVLKQ